MPKTCTWTIARQESENSCSLLSYFFTQIGLCVQLNIFKPNFFVKFIKQKEQCNEK